MPENITLMELLGKEFKEADYMVSSNWRIDFSACKELKELMGEYAGDTPKQMSFACHSNFQFETNIEYAEAEIKGMHISQAAWQDRYIDSLTLDVYEKMDHRLFKALVTASNNTAGYYASRDINKKEKYTFSGITLRALGNTDGGDTATVELVYSLLGVQIKRVQSPEYTSDSAEIGSVQLELKAHGWGIINGIT